MRQMRPRRPSQVDWSYTGQLRDMYKLFPALVKGVPENVVCYVVNQRCGKAYYAKRVITQATQCGSGGYFQKEGNTMTKRRRISEILTVLSEMSRDWNKWKSYDWKPLETELRLLR